MRVGNPSLRRILRFVEMTANRPCGQVGCFSVSDSYDWSEEFSPAAIPPSRTANRVDLADGAAARGGAPCEVAPRFRQLHNVSQGFPHDVYPAVDRFDAALMRRA